MMLMRHRYAIARTPRSFVHTIADFGFCNYKRTKLTKSDHYRSTKITRIEVLCCIFLKDNLFNVITKYH